MAVYYLNQAIILGLAYPLCINKPSGRKKAIYLTVTFGYMWFLATFRSNIGFDYHSYISIFERIQSAGSLGDVLAFSYEPGFSTLTWLMAKGVHSSTVMYGIYSALILAPVAVFIHRYCGTAWLSTWLYVTLSFFYTAMNFIRQSLACGVVLLGYGFLKERKPLPYFLVVLVGASFHKTALIMIPFYFLAQIPLTIKTGSIYAASALIAYLASPWLLDIATEFVFTGYKNSIYIDPAYGFSPVFLLVPFTITALCLAMLPIWRDRCPQAGMLTNMMLLSATIWLFITHHFILERFSHYSYLLAILAVPSALDSLKASPAEYVQLAAGEASHRQGGVRAHKALGQRIRDHEKYYWAGVLGVLLVTWLYNEFGQHISGFHNVFPYQSVLW